MSLTCRMRIMLAGSDPSLDDQVLDAIAPRWWNANKVGRTGDVLWLEGIDRLCGVGILMDLHSDLRSAVRAAFGSDIRVKIAGSILEGNKFGTRFSHGTI